MTRHLSIASALLILSAASVQAQTIQACVNPSSGEIKVRAQCQPGWNPFSMSTGTAAGGKLVGEKTWTTETSIPGNEPRTLTDSTFTAVTNGGPLLISTVIHFWFSGGDAEGFASCHPVIDGQWAGVYGGLPTTENDMPWGKEGAVYMQRRQANYFAWTPSRVYRGVPAGTHTFALRCEGSLFSVFGPASFSAGGNMPATLSVVEVQQ